MLLFNVVMASQVLFSTSPATQVNLDYATNDTTSAWGLMQRTQIPQNYGMVFYHKEPSPISLWMFNCFADLSVAFLDQNKVIREIREMKAYPEKMDPARPVLSLRDLARYSAHDPIIHFFYDRGTHSTFNARYAVEMAANAYTERNIKPGDVFVWSEGSPQAHIMHTVNLDSQPKPTTIALQGKSAISVWAPSCTAACTVTFLDNQKQVVNKGTIPACAHLPLIHKPVLICHSPVSYLYVE